jgi:hypothetical protein
LSFRWLVHSSTHGVGETVWRVWGAIAMPARSELRQLSRSPSTRHDPWCLEVGAPLARPSPSAWRGGVSSSIAVPVESSRATGWEKYHFGQGGPLLTYPPYTPFGQRHADGRPRAALRIHRTWTSPVKGRSTVRTAPGGHTGACHRADLGWSRPKPIRAVAVASGWS